MVQNADDSLENEQKKNRVCLKKVPNNLFREVLQRDVFCKI